MGNLYTIRKSVDEVAAHFSAEVPKPIDMKPDTAKEGPGDIVRAHQGRRRGRAVGRGVRGRPREEGGGPASGGRASGSAGGSETGRPSVWAWQRALEHAGKCRDRCATRSANPSAC